MVLPTVKVSLLEDDDGPIHNQPDRGQQPTSPFEVTAEDETTKKLYTITVMRQSTTGDDDASLSALTLSDTTVAEAAKAVPLNPPYRTRPPRSVELHGGGTLRYDGRSRLTRRRTEVKEASR